MKKLLLNRWIVLMLLVLSMMDPHVHADEDGLALGLTLQPKSIQGLEQVNGYLRLTNPQSVVWRGGCWKEAEAAVLDFAPGGEIVRTAMGGLAVTRCNKVAFTVRPPSPGSYTVWYLARFPFKGSWSHSERLGERTLSIVDSDQVSEQNWNQWVWIKGGTHELSGKPVGLWLNWMGEIGRAHV